MDEKKLAMKNNEIKVSIVIPVYNSEKTIGKCLDSLVNQTYENIEIICVNDCSKDNSLSVLEQYAAQDRRIVVINHIENKNAGGARNSGMKAATGDYICFVDNDDWLRLDAIEILVSASDKGKYDIVAPQWCEVYADGKETVHQNYVVGNDRDASVHYLLFHGGRMLGVLFKRTMIFQHDIFFPEKLFWEDNAIGACFFLASKSMKVIGDVLYYYYIGVANSSSRSISYQKVKDRIISTDLFVENAKKKGLYEQFAEEIDWRYLDLSVYSIELLGQIPYKQAKPLTIYLESQIRKLMPNRYFDLFDQGSKVRLLNPLKYIQCEDRKRKRRNVKGFFHGIRHFIVVMIKRMLGMDPTKSIYNEK